MTPEELEALESSIPDWKKRGTGSNRITSC